MLEITGRDFFLRGFRYMREGNPKAAIPELVNATKERRYRGSAISQLGIAYFRTGNFSKLEDLLKNSGSAVERSAFLLDLRAQLHTAENDYAAAERDIQILARLPEDNSRSRKRRAIILAKRDKAYAVAIQLISELIERERGRAIPLRFLRGIIAAKAGDRTTAMADADFVKANARKSGQRQYHKISARLAIGERNWRTALATIDKLGSELEVSDRFTRADALRLKAEDPTVGITEREAAKDEITKIVGRSTSYSDLDFTEDE
jgi:hypothetical protein